MCKQLICSLPTEEHVFSSQDGVILLGTGRRCSCFVPLQTLCIRCPSLPAPSTRTSLRTQMKASIMELNAVKLILSPAVVSLCTFSCSSNSTDSCCSTQCVSCTMSIYHVHSFPVYRTTCTACPRTLTAWKGPSHCEFSTTDYICNSKELQGSTYACVKACSPAVSELAYHSLGFLQPCLRERSLCSTSSLSLLFVSRFKITFLLNSLKPKPQGSLIPVTSQNPDQIKFPSS